jgi:hypothetical protein
MKTLVALGIALGGALLTMSGPAFAQAAATACVETLTPPAVAALAPTDVQLAVSAPLAGMRVDAAPVENSIAVTVKYLGPPLVPAAMAHAVDDYHLAYLLDQDDGGYLRTLLPIPHCNPRVVHSAWTTATFSGVQPGSHVLSVVLVGSNDVAVNPPVATSVTFLVK